MPTASSALLCRDQEIEMPDVGTGAEVLEAEDLQVEVLESSERERWSVFFLIVCALLLGVGVFFFGVHEFQQQSTYRVWWLFFLLAPMSMFYSKVWHIGSNYFLERRFISVVVDSMRSPILFEALSANIADAADIQSSTSSTDVSAFTEYDKSRGRLQVRLNYWGSRSRSIRILVYGRPVTIDFSRGEDVVCGRDQSVQNRERLTLLLQVSRDRLADKRLLKTWLETCVGKFRQPPTGLVEVLALDQSSSDWVPEWKTRCVRPLKSSDGAGHSFFLQRGSARPLLADACTWSGRELRIYLLAGPPGVGKTELTIWLAGFLRVPLYRIALNDSRLTDQLFAQLVSPTSLKHDNSVIQIDEFQETLKRWKVNMSDGQGVSMEGFCEVLQGSNSLSRGFIVLSGTHELLEIMREPVFAVVFRRVCIIAELSWLLVEDTQTFFMRFLKDFVPLCPEEELSKHGSHFTRKGSHWSGVQISIDMIKQFLMLRISSYRARFLSENVLAPEAAFHIPPGMYSDFFAWVSDAEAGAEYLSAYAPVGAHGVCVSTQ